MTERETTLIVRAVLSLGRRLRAERPAGTATLPEIGILATLRLGGPMPAVRLAAEERLQPQSLTRHIQRLERDGLIERRPSETDRRELLIALTPQGEETLAEDIRSRGRWLDRAMRETLDASERSVLVEAAKIMLRLSGQSK